MPRTGLCSWVSGNSGNDIYSILIPCFLWMQYLPMEEVILCYFKQEKLTIGNQLLTDNIHTICFRNYQLVMLLRLQKKWTFLFTWPTLENQPWVRLHLCTGPRHYTTRMLLYRTIGSMQPISLSE